MEFADQLVKTLKEFRRLSKSYFGESDKSEMTRIFKREALEPHLFELLDNPKAKETIMFLRLGNRLDHIDMLLIETYYEDD